ncbi:hypothetical protein SAMN05216299_10415 [Nitrosospira sp. Nsp14]|uniref:hypothetical protein n=1 Tax=Nitrosospira sp. Nsp14 TaxID=1855333 RepID=UPI0008E68D24|nr:hypothetical protein [Nitrosospira sp. Nsp14]SFH25295.1 hypothetical protein SAMN05216299_10415 [Nitrosospira sp. Nsp14]
MPSYAVYIRTKEGHVERMKNVVSHLPHIARSSPGTSNPYVHEEPLVGFPESTVLWAARTGPSVGIAPLSPDLGVRAAGSPSVGMKESA